MRLTPRTAAVGAGFLAVALAGALLIDRHPMPSLVVGEIVAQGDATGVPCEVALWQGPIRPLEGRGEPLATGHARTGGTFVAELSPARGTRRRPGHLWATVQCEGYAVKVYGFEWRWVDGWIRPGVDLGRVYVPAVRRRRR